MLWNRRLANSAGAPLLESDSNDDATTLVSNHWVTMWPSGSRVVKTACGIGVCDHTALVRPRLPTPPTVLKEKLCAASAPSAGKVSPQAKELTANFPVPRSSVVSGSPPAGKVRP